MAYSILSAAIKELFILAICFPPLLAPPISKVYLLSYRVICLTGFYNKKNKTKKGNNETKKESVESLKDATDSLI